MLSSRFTSANGFATLNTLSNPGCLIIILRVFHICDIYISCNHVPLKSIITMTWSIQKIPKFTQILPRKSFLIQNNTNRVTQFSYNPFDDDISSQNNKKNFVPRIKGFLFILLSLRSLFRFGLASEKFPRRNHKWRWYVWNHHQREIHFLNIFFVCYFCLRSKLTTENDKHFEHSDKHSLILCKHF